MGGNKMKKKLALLLAGAVLVTSFVACTKETEKKQEPLEEVTLTVAGPWPDCEAIDLAASGFEDKYPNCHIEYEYVQDFDENMIKRLTADEEELDMFLSSNIQKTSKYFPYALDFSTVEDQVDLSNTFDGLIDNARLQSTDVDEQEQIYAIPLGAEVRGMFVNVSLLDSLNIKVPTNREEFLSACETLKQAGYIPLQGNPGTMGQQFLYPYICNMIANAEDYDSTYAMINERQEGVSELFRDPMEFLYLLMEKGYYNYKYAETELGLFMDVSNEGMARDFMNIAANEDGNYEKSDDGVGQIAFMPGQQSLESSIQKIKEDYHSDIEYKFILSPVGEDGGYAYMSPGRAIAVNKNSLNMEWTLKFVNYLISEEGNKVFCHAMGFIPNTKDAFDIAMKQFDIPKNHISQLGQVTFNYDFYTIIYTSLLNISKGNNPKYMKTNEDGTTELYSLEYYMKQLEEQFQTVE
jgi:ABC-type glycerol-3-phosphate transport system substrate-binding protein